MKRPFFQAKAQIRKAFWKYDSFDWPDYCGVPARVHSRLTGDEVDELQKYFYDLTVKRERRHEELKRIRLKLLRRSA